MRRNTTALAVILLVLLSVAGGAAPAGAAEPVADATVGPAVDGAAIGADAPAAHARAGCSYPVTEPDATGTEVTVDGEPERIVALGASTAQTLWELDAQGKVVGVSAFATHLEGAEDRTTVTEVEGFSTTVLVEEIISLDPDIVLAANVYTTQNQSLQQLRDAGITVYTFEAAGSIEDVYAKTERIGHLAGACDAANATVEEMRTTVDTIREAVDGEERPRVLYPQGQGFAPGPSTFIGALIDAAGGENIVANANATSPYPQLSGEFVVEQDPEWLIVAAPPGQLDADPTELAPDNPALRNTTAWEEGNFVVVEQNNISQPAPRIISPLRKMAQAFHPEAYAAARATPTPTDPPATGDATPTATAGTGDGTTTPTGTETEAPGQPGLGIGAAVAALLGLLALTRRR